MASESKEPDCYRLEEVVEGYNPFSLERWNTNPNILAYSEKLKKIYNTVLCNNRFNPTANKDRDIIRTNHYFGGFTAYDNISTIARRLFPTVDNVEIDILTGLILKIYGGYFLVPYWPPLKYPENNTLPPLCKVNGYIYESSLASSIRILGVLANLLHKSSVQEVFNSILSVDIPSNTSDAGVYTLKTLFGPDTKIDQTRIFSSLTFSEIISIFRDEWVRANAIEGRTILFNTDPEPGRFVNSLRGNATWNAYLISLLNMCEWTEFQSSFANPITNPHFTRKLKTRDQQMFIIIPKDADINTFNITVNDSSGILSKETISEYVWVQLDFDFTQKLKIQDGGSTIYQYQGYRLTNFPHPEVLLAIAHGVKDMSSHMRSLYPEWGSPATRKRWVLSALETWNRDIEAMTEPHQKYVQRYLYNDVMPKIQSVFAAMPGENTLASRDRIDTNIKRLAANADTTDPNTMFGRVQNFQQSYSSVLVPLKAAGSIIELQERNKGKRWYGAAIEPKDAYRAKIKTYIARIQQALGDPSEISTEVDVILKLARTPKPNTRDLYVRFNAWRNTLDRTKLSVELVRKIDEVRPAGFFEGATGYAAKIVEMVLATQQTGKQVVAGAVLDNTLTGISSGVRALEQDIAALPRDSQTEAIRDMIHEIPSYIKGTMDPRIYLVTVFDGLNRVYEMYTAWKNGLPFPLARSRPAAPNLTSLAGGGARRKTRAKSKGMRRSTRKQRGGAATGMPLAYYQDGAQMRGTYAEPTGVGLGAATNSMVRSEITQTGGRRKEKQQAGGFIPSLMGPVVQNGMYLMPVASFMGYRMLKGKRIGRSTSRSAHSSSSRSAHHKGSHSAHHKGSRSAHHKGSHSAHHKGSHSAHHKGSHSAHRGPRTTQKKRRSTSHRSR